MSIDVRGKVGREELAERRDEGERITREAVKPRAKGFRRRPFN